MSYREEVKSAGDLFMASKELRAEVQKALDENRTVEFEHSSFSDSGSDWTKILIDNKQISISRGF